MLAAPAPGPEGQADPRSPEKRRADALMLLVSWGLASDQLSITGGEAVTVTVVTTPGHLQSLIGLGSCNEPGNTGSLAASDADQLAGDADVDPDAAADVEVKSPGLREDAAFLEDGTPLSPESTRRLGCDAWLLAAIVDSAGALLDIGRRSRIVPAALRRALIVRDGGCAFPGCGRPAGWCHAHHIRHWACGGPTALSNLVLLCPCHHRVVHHDGWTVHIGDRRLPVFTPPRWVDPDQTPRPAWRPLTVLRT